MPRGQPNVGQQYIFVKADPEHVIHTPVSWLRKIKDRIKQIGEHNKILENAAWCLIGFGASCLIAALSSYSASTPD